MTKETANKYAKLKIKMEKLVTELKLIQEMCKHENESIEYKSNTGNYDPSCDSYWVTHDCLDCGKFWVTDK